MLYKPCFWLAHMQCVEEIVGKWYPYAYYSLEVSASLSFILIWGLEAAINTELLRPSIKGIDISLQNAISTILICRFMLNLRKFTEHPNGTRSGDGEATIGTFRAGIRRIDVNIINEFGDSCLEEFSVDYGGEDANESCPDSADLGGPNCTNPGMSRIGDLGESRVEELYSRDVYFVVPYVFT
ncbi:hypothetical protein M422DRAFT_246175 [Sphaerobolus stellatus SS14]|nr:hypothetical protein M422DRAFT_246175 [Sphaerobolus stellatus SS14]